MERVTAHSDYPPQESSGVDEEAFNLPNYTRSNQKAVTQLLNWHVPKDALLRVSASTFSPLFLLDLKGYFLGIGQPAWIMSGTDS